MASSGNTSKSGERPAAVDPALLTVTRPELLSDGSDLGFREVIHELLVFVDQLGKIRDGFAKIIGVSAIQYEILQQLRRVRPRTLNVSELSRTLHRSLPFTTIEIGKLAKRSLVVKTPDAVDRRRVYVGLTGAGIELLRSVAPYQRRTNDVLFESLRPADLDRLRRLLPLLNDDAERAGKLLHYLAVDRRPIETPSGRDASG